MILFLRVFSYAFLFVFTFSAVNSLCAKNQGPGLGNIKYKKSELNKLIAKISENSDNGAPARPSNAPKKHWGMNTGSMINGYFVVPFAYDSGNANGGLLVYDLSDPRKPKLVKRVYDERTK